MNTCFVHISSLLFIVCAFFIRPSLAATGANKGHTTGNRQRELQGFSIFLNLISEQHSANCSCKTGLFFSYAFRLTNLT